MSKDSVPALREAWQAFCEQLKDAGEIAFDPELPGGDVDRAAGVRQVVRNIALAWQFEFENADPLYPVFAHYFDPMRKQGGDNPDALYLGAPINGDDSYRISGHRGSVDYVAITAVERGGTPFGGGVAGMLLGDDLLVNPDGSFEIHVGPEQKGVNWLRTSPDCYRVTVRQFFSDWEKEQPMRLSIERLGSTEPRPAPTPTAVEAGLSRSAQWLKESLAYWPAMLKQWKARPETFLAYSELERQAVDATPGGEPVIAYWQLEADEALVVRVMPPQARYWSVEIGNALWESMDYRDRLSSTNSHYATLEEDGELVIVVAHQDSGHANWLDASGHGEGYITFRWIGVAHPPRPVAQRVKAQSLPQLLAGHRTVTRQERHAQISARRRGLHVRGWT